MLHIRTTASRKEGVSTPVASAEEIGKEVGGRDYACVSAIDCGRPWDTRWSATESPSGSNYGILEQNEPTQLIPTINQKKKVGEGRHVISYSSGASHRRYE